MKQLLCAIAWLTLSVAASAQNGQCVTCSGNLCQGIHGPGSCVCDDNCISGNRCFCSSAGICVIKSDGIAFCESNPPKKGVTCTPRPPQAGAATPTEIEVHPWLVSKEFPVAIGRLSGVSEAQELLEQLQAFALSKGYSRDMQTQTTIQLGEGKPARMEDVHLSRLAGVKATLQEDGAYLFEFYVDQAAPSGETRYKGVSDMRHDKVAPVETVRVSGESYTHALGGASYSGEFK
jgi:hypothetical protein